MLHGTKSKYRIPPHNYISIVFILENFNRCVMTLKLNESSLNGMINLLYEMINPHFLGGICQIWPLNPYLPP